MSWIRLYSEMQGKMPIINWISIMSLELDDILNESSSDDSSSDHDKKSADSGNKAKLEDSKSDGQAEDEEGQVSGEEGK